MRSRPVGTKYTKIIVAGARSTAHASPWTTCTASATPASAAASLARSAKRRSYSTPTPRAPRSAAATSSRPSPHPRSYTTSPGPAPSASSAWAMAHAGVGLKGARAAAAAARWPGAPSPACSCTCPAKRRPARPRTAAWMAVARLQSDRTFLASSTNSPGPARPPSSPLTGAAVPWSTTRAQTSRAAPGVSDVWEPGGPTLSRSQGQSIHASNVKAPVQLQRSHNASNCCLSSASSVEPASAVALSAAAEPSAGAGCVASHPGLPLQWERSSARRVSALPSPSGTASRCFWHHLSRLLRASSPRAFVTAIQTLGAPTRRQASSSATSSCSGGQTAEGGTAVGMARRSPRKGGPAGVA
mmetsp:Transcript_61705/g.171037  ORF Transcript_61705/g.171037 Transcript_61705/m.171037 type:complete len:357 (+) Transcript_61705:219-1289(+)